MYIGEVSILAFKGSRARPGFFDSIIIQFKKRPRVLLHVTMYFCSSLTNEESHKVSQRSLSTLGGSAIYFFFPEELWSA